MLLNANAKLGLAGRLALVRVVEDGGSLREAAVAFNVSPATAHRWWHRWLDGGRRPEALFGSLEASSPLAARAGTGVAGADLRLSPRDWLGPRLVAAATGFAHSTVWKVLKRGRDLAAAEAGQGADQQLRVALPRRPLAHVDVSRYARFLRPGHRATGDRSQRSRRWRRPETRVGCDYAHAIVDDHSRLAFVELYPDETAGTVTAFVERALAYFVQHGITAKRLMTDNAFAYVKNRSLRELLARRGIRHLTTEPYRPRTNGKVERFHQTTACDGLRTLLPLTPPTQPGAAILARPLQPAQATQLNRRPATYQPRSQRPWVAHLASRMLVHQVRPFFPRGAAAKPDSAELSPCTLRAVRHDKRGTDGR